MPTLPRRSARTARRQRGAILIESLVALALLSLGAAAMFHAFEHLEASSHAARLLGMQARTGASQADAR